jgi:hypothetical protein
MPLTSKGRKIMSAMQEKYGEKEGKSVFYASKNAGRIKGVDAFRATMRDALAKGVPLTDALGAGIKAAHNTADAVRTRRKTFFKSMRDGISKGMPARDVIRDALGVQPSVTVPKKQPLVQRTITK